MSGIFLRPFYSNMLPLASLMLLPVVTSVVSGDNARMILLSNISYLFRVFVGNMCFGVLGFGILLLWP